MAIDKTTAFKRIATAAGFVFCAIILLLAVKGYMDGDFTSIDSFKAYINRFGVWGPIILTGFQIFQVVVPIVPGMVGCAAGAMLFGTVGGFWCNYIGISIGSIIAFYIGRRYGVHVVQKLIGEDNYNKYLGWIDNKKSFLIALFLSILLPLAPDDILCFLSGLTNMNSKKFITIIITAKPWCILFYCIFFNKLL